MFGVMCLSSILVVASEPEEKLNTTKPTRAKDGIDGANGYFNGDGQPCGHGQKGENGQCN